MYLSFFFWRGEGGVCLLDCSVSFVWIFFVVVFFVRNWFLALFWVFVVAVVVVVIFWDSFCLLICFVLLLLSLFCFLFHRND